MRAEYEYCQRKEVKAEVSSLEEKLAELETRAIPYLTREQIIKVINHVQDAINKKSAENLRAIIQNFVNKIVVSKDEIVIEFKLKFERDWSGRTIQQHTESMRGLQITLFHFQCNSFAL